MTNNDRPSRSADVRVQSPPDQLESSTIQYILEHQTIRLNRTNLRAVKLLR